MQNNILLFQKFSNLVATFTNKEHNNLAFHVGDDEWHVEHNHETLACEFGYDTNNLVHMKQIHSANVHIVTENDSFTSPPTCDALLTNKKNVPLMVMVADCAPLLFYDAVHKAIAVVHAGRAGAFSNIIANTLHAMKQEYKSNPKDIYVAMGANIKACCYEVGAEIYEEAQTKNLAHAIQIRDEKYYLDISKILLEQLMACGIEKAHLEISRECTCCDTNKYFSYRAEGKTGRFAGILMLK
jgi:hypothetical protein